MGGRFGRRIGIFSWLRRFFDERAEERALAGGQDAILTHRGRDHAVLVTNVSKSGAMVVFAQDASPGDRVVLRLLDQDARAGQVRWIRDGYVGINFVGSAQ